MFGNILKMLFFYKFFTFSWPFSQLPNKFYIRKSTTTHTQAPTKNPPLSTQNPPTTQHKNHQNTTTTTKTKKKIKDQRLRDWGKERSVFSGGNEIGLGWWWRCMACGRLPRSKLNLSRRCMAGDRKVGSWVFVDRWWGKGGPVMASDRWWRRGTA